MTLSSVALSITTPGLEIGGPVGLSDGHAEVVSYDPGGIVKRRQLVRSPSVVGARQTDSIADKRLMRLVLRIYGTSKSDLDTNTQFWINVFEQLRYHTTVTINSVDTTWACDDAEYSLVNDNDDGGVDKYRLNASPLRQLWGFLIPTDPYPTAGVF